MPRLDNGAKRHLQRGFGVRLGILEEAVLELESKIGKSRDPLDYRVATNLTALLNSYYLHACGALDNLAWALVYILDDGRRIDEDNVDDQRLANLSDRKLRKALREAGSADLAASLKGLSTWYRDLRTLRDPAAHRTPLYVPRTVLNEAEAERHREIDAEAADLIRHGHHHEGMAHLATQERLGQHYPVFIVESPEIRIFNLPNRVARDHEKLIQVGEAVLVWIGRRVQESA